MGLRTSGQGLKRDAWQHEMIIFRPNGTYDALYLFATAGVMGARRAVVKRVGAQQVVRIVRDMCVVCVTKVDI